MREILDHNHKPIENYERKDELKKLVDSVRDFVLGICPEEWKPIVQKNYEKFDFIIAEKGTGSYNLVRNGNQVQKNLDGAGAYCFMDNYDSEKNTCNFSSVIDHKATVRQIVHELMHGLSADMFKTETEKVVKFGSTRQTITKGKEGVVATGSESLNEGITEVLTEWYMGGAKGALTGTSGYGPEVILAHLFTGSEIKNNAFIQDVYFGDGKKFAEKFNAKVSDPNTTFDSYLNKNSFNFNNLKNLPLFQSAIECTLKRAKTPEQVKAEISFMQNILNQADNFLGVADENIVETLTKFINEVSQKHLESLKSSSEDESERKVVPRLQPALGLV